jgi:hypothetical protein
VRAGRGAAAQLVVVRSLGWNEAHNEARSDEVIRASFGGYGSVGG